MCGIFGVVLSNSRSEPPATKLRASAQALGHRGPDDQSIHVAPGFGLAHTRLSFVDVDERSNQPFWDASGRYVLVFNGEIYNFRELRDELTARGAAFRTTSDTEVLLEALIRDGAEAVLPRLMGMFAFGFYDVQTRNLLLARDRFGMKPLHTLITGEGVFFASEVKAFAPWTTLQADRFMTAAYLLGFGGPTQGASFYEGVRTVAPGGYVRVSGDGVVEEGTFFTLTDFLDTDLAAELAHQPEARIVDQVDELLNRSVESHLFCDVPVGAFCSGGVDSSLLMAVASRKYGDLAIFHSNLRGRWSEHDAAAALATHLKLDLKVVDVDDQDFVDRAAAVTRHYEQPFTYHPNCAPLMMVADLARQNGVKGLLSGEGSDELYLGYPWLGRKKIVDAYEGAGRALRGAVRSIPELGPLMWPAQGERHLKVRALLSRREIADDELTTRRAVGRARAPRETAWSLDHMQHHLRTLLHRNDTMGMAASIEARFPFLDHALVKTSVNLPPKYKLRFDPSAAVRGHPFVRDKWIVRKVADRYLPKHLSRRTKLGFWTTVFERLEVRPTYFDDSFTRDLLGLSRDQMVRTLADADRDLIVRLLHLDIWGRVCLEGVSDEVATAKLREETAIVAERG